MTRSIPPSLASVLERLELDAPMVVTIDQLSEILREEQVQSPANVVASRLRERGWLLPTGQRGVWEFAPAAVAGPYSQHDVLLPFRAFLARRSRACGLTFQAAAWAHGLADRAPKRLEVAVADVSTARALPRMLDPSMYVPRLDYEQLRSVPVLAVESVAVQMAATPGAVRSWSSASEWFPELAATLEPERLARELAERERTVWVRAGYLLQGVRPDLAEQLRAEAQPRVKTWFGPRGKLRRHDNRWQVADTLLPFDPKTMESAR